MISTELIVMPMSIYFHGRVTSDFFITGIVCASVVSLIVCYFLINLSGRVLAAQAKFKTLFESATDALFITDFTGKLIDINRTAYERLGYTREEMLSMSLKELDAPEAAKKVSRRIEKLQRYGHSVFESAHISKNGGIMPVEINARVMEYGGQKVIFGVARDISERKRAEKDKDTLLREIHHRVKNNMQVISSLLNIQARHIEDKQLLAIFQDCQNRIKAMALVHEELYQSNNLSRIDVKHYIGALLDGLASSLSRKPDVALTVTVDKIFFNIDTAIPCGLIITELVTNSFKHAFRKRERGEISVELRQDGGVFNLMVKDDGVGLPDGFDVENTASLGLQLVHTLAAQIGGTVEILSGRGTEARIVFEEVRSGTQAL
ncbi:MAG: PAS domain S-box protein [Nitrospirae bacterium]|nr:PAS domain S-box protein [Nitrospirota bacterium]